MSADEEALRNSTGLVHGWTDVAVPRMARSDTHSESPEVLRFSFSLKGIAMERAERAKTLSPLLFTRKLINNPLILKKY